MSSIFQRQQIANLITISRLGFLPLLFLAGILQQPVAFVGLFAIQAFLDAVDGLVARRLQIESDLGRRLDTVIDLAIWLPSIVIFVWLVWDEFTDVFSAYPHLFIIPTITVTLMYLTAYHYLHTFAAIHLYSGKLTAALIILLMLTMLLNRFYPVLGYLTACAGVMYHLEAITIYAIQKDQTDENVTSLWQMLRRQ
ncbi:MAG: CDP-alcohol phosphatidyltransferase family protein [Anaerolineae bacterium]|nr:CDP-alcohol phosphatidyltransferase family protein [Anaerolineae bacterium]